MKILEATITLRTEKGDFIQGDRVEADDLVQLVSQLMLGIASIHRRLLKDAKIGVEDDRDIPF